MKSVVLLAVALTRQAFFPEPDSPNSHLSLYDWSKEPREVKESYLLSFVSQLSSAADFQVPEIGPIEGLGAGMR
jgi:hypothetical protein